MSKLGRAHDFRLPQWRGCMGDYHKNVFKRKCLSNVTWKDGRLACEGRKGSVNGATQIRAGVMRPEILVPIHEDVEDQPGANKGEQGVLEIGTTIRVIRDPYFGMLGEVASLPPEPQVLGSGSKARVLEVKFPGGDTVVVPRANVELIEG